MEETVTNEGGVGVLSRRRGASWGPDGIFYPSTEPREVPLSGAAILLIFYLQQGLRALLYPVHERVYVAADQFIYYLPGDPSRNVAPDVWVCFGVPQQPERQVFRTWEEGATPSFVVEISSGESRAEDRGRKFELYQDVLGCQEYLIYDEQRDELLLYRRAGDRFQLVAPDENERVYSRELGCWFGREPGVLVRVYDARGVPVPTPQEERERAAEADRRAAEADRRAAEERERADALAAENARLLAELERFRRHPSGS